jgi:hypothetical protein
VPRLITRRWSRRLALIAAGGVLLLFTGCEPLTSNELAHEAGSIHSTAAEGALLAEGAANQDSLASFVRAHAKELADAADTSARKLHDGTVPAGLKAPTAHAIELASRTSAALGDLELSPSNPALAATVELRLKRLAAAAAALEGSV